MCVKQFNRGFMKGEKLSVDFRKLNNPSREMLAARDKFFEQCDRLDIREEDGVVVLEVDGFELKCD